MVIKITESMIEKVCGSRLTGRIRRVARVNGGLPKTFRDIVEAGTEVLEARIVGEAEPVATRPFEPRESHVTL